MGKRLTELNPRWVAAGGEGITNQDGSPVPYRHGVGVSFDCPCGCGVKAYIPFTNPLDGGPAREDKEHTWNRTGDTFETLTLAPSIQRSDPDGCRWHGYIENGETRNA